MANKLTTEEWIIRAKKIHGDNLDYVDTVYTSVFSPVSIRCKKHGVFTRIASYHMSGAGCPNCSAKVSGLNSKAGEWVSIKHIPMPHTTIENILTTAFSPTRNMTEHYLLGSAGIGVIQSGCVKKLLAGARGEYIKICFDEQWGRYEYYVDYVVKDTLLIHTGSPGRTRTRALNVSASKLSDYMEIINQGDNLLNIDIVVDKTLLIYVTRDIGG